jgi:hypothetical protein
MHDDLILQIVCVWLSVSLSHISPISIALRACCIDCLDVDLTSEALERECFSCFFTHLLTLH